MNDLISDKDNGYAALFITGWFFDVGGLENLMVHDVMDLITWCMFEGQNQECLTNKEKIQLKEFISELEWRLSFYLYSEYIEEDEVDD